MIGLPIRIVFFIAIVFLFFLPNIRAEADSTVVLVAHSGSSKIALRLDAELSSLGYKTVIVDLPSPIPQSVLNQMIEDYKAKAIMQVSPEERSVQISIIKDKDMSVFLQEITDSDDDERAGTIVAIKSVELLRANLLSISETEANEPLLIEQDTEKEKPQELPTVKEETTKPSSENSETVKNFSYRLSAALQPAAVFGFGGWSPIFNIGLSLNVGITSRLGLEIRGLIPSFPADEIVPEGKLTISDGTISIGLRFNLVSNTHRIIPLLSVSAGALILKAQGHSDLNYDSHKHMLVTSILSGTFAILFFINETAAIRFDTSAGITVPKPVFSVLERKETDFGRPLLVVLLGVEIKLF